MDLELIGADSRFDPGWSGSTHGVGLPQGSRTSVKIDQCDDECRRCAFHGPVRGATGTVISQRCLNDVSLSPCETDQQCVVGGQDKGPCRFVFPPIAAMTGALSTCSVTYFEPIGGKDPVQGYVDLFTGQSDLKVLNMLIKLGVGSCSFCQGDPTAFDGNAGGMCSVSKKACDVNGTGANGGTSFDCPPDFALSSTIVLGTNGTSTSSVEWAMDPATRPFCTNSMGVATTTHCWCGMCTDGSPCTSNKDCATGSCGAGVNPANAMIKWFVQNGGCASNTTAGVCNWNATTQSGKCSTAPNQSCYPDTGSMIATGFAEVHDGFYITQLANLICMPSFNNGMGISGAVDTVGGFPGPFLFQSKFRVTKRFGP